MQNLAIYLLGLCRCMVHGAWTLFLKCIQFSRKITLENPCGPGTFNKEMARRINGKPRFFSCGRNLCGWYIFLCDEYIFSWLLVNVLENCFKKQFLEI